MSIRTLVSQLVARSRLANVAGHTFRGKRDIYKTLGYARELYVNDYRSRYTRNAVANRVVKATAMATWHGSAELLEDKNVDEALKTSPFEDSWFQLEQRLKLWSVFQRADVLAGIGRYAIVLLGLPGDMITPVCEIDPLTNEFVRPRAMTERQLSYVTSKAQPKFASEMSSEQLRTLAEPQPIMFGPNDLKYVRPYSEEDAKIFKFDLDPLSPRFGLPLFYNITRTTMLSPESTNSNVVAKVVHWSRIIHVADGLLDDNVYGEPRLQCVWNLLDDLEKVTGAGAEAFWRRADRGIQFDLDPTLEFEDEDKSGSGAPDPAKNAGTRKQIEEMEHGLRNYLFTRGVKIKELGSNVANFSAPVASLISQISAGTGIPQRLLMGSERGELSSSQDKEEWNERIRSRRLEHAGPNMVRPFADRMIAIGVLPKPTKEYWVRWPSMSQMNETQKATLAQQYMALNKDDTVVTRDEVRDLILGLEPMTEGQEDGESAMWSTAEKAKHLSVNEKREMCGYKPWTGDIDTTPYYDIPEALLPKESLRITDTDVPLNAPGGTNRTSNGNGGVGMGAPRPGTVDLGSRAKMQERVAARKGAATETHVHRAADRFRARDEARRLRVLRRRQEGRAPNPADARPRAEERSSRDGAHVYGRDGIRKELEG